jgi:hypothetical protein
VLSGVTRCVVLMVTVTVIHAQDQSKPTFDVASVKRSTGDGTAGGVRPQPDGITATDASLLLLLRVAYNVQDYQILGPIGSREIGTTSLPERQFPSLASRCFSRCCKRSSQTASIWSCVASNSRGPYTP